MMSNRDNFPLMRFLLLWSLNVWWSCMDRCIRWRKSSRIFCIYSCCPDMFMKWNQIIRYLSRWFPFKSYQRLFSVSAILSFDINETTSIRMQNKRARKKQKKKTIKKILTWIENNSSPSFAHNTARDCRRNVFQVIHV